MNGMGIANAIIEKPGYNKERGMVLPCRGRFTGFLSLIIAVLIAFSAIPAAAAELDAYFEVKTDGFSSFAIVGVNPVQSGAPPAAAANPPMPGTTVTTAVSPPSGLNWIIYAMAGLTIVAAAYLFVMKGR